MNLNNIFPEQPGSYIMHDPISDMSYVGATINLHKRMHAHRCALKNNNHSNSGLQKMYNGNNELIVHAVTLDNNDDAFAFEQSLLDDFFDSGLLTNKARYSNNALLGNKSRLGLKHTEDTIAKMSSSHLKRHETYVISEETKAKRKESMKDYVIKDETREKLRIASTGRFYSEETRKKMSDMRIGIQFTDEHRAKLAEKKNVPIIVNNMEFPSMKIAAEQLSLTRRIVQTRCHSPNYPDWTIASFNP